MTVHDRTRLIGQLNFLINRCQAPLSISLLALFRPFAVLTAVMAVQLVAVEWLCALLGLASEKNDAKSLPLSCLTRLSS